MSANNKEAAEKPVDGFDLLKVREAEVRQQAITVNAGRKPKFGDRMRNPWASERNPQRDGIFIRARRTTGRFNPGLWYEMTDGKGEFWTSNGDVMMFLDHLEAPATEQAPPLPEPAIERGSNMECGFADCDYFTGDDMEEFAEQYAAWKIAALSAPPAVPPISDEIVGQQVWHTEAGELMQRDLTRKEVYLDPSEQTPAREASGPEGLKAALLFSAAYCVKYGIQHDQTAAKLESIAQRTRALQKAGFDLTAKLCAIKADYVRGGRELISRDAVMDLVVLWREAFDTSPKSAHTEEWARAAAEALYAKLDEIDGEAHESAYFAQDISAHHQRWVELASEVIALSAAPAAPQPQKEQPK